MAGYLVFYSEFSNGPFFYHGFTTDTAYVHVRAAQFAPAMYYHVVAYVGELVALTRIEMGMREEDVLSTLTN